MKKFRHTLAAAGLALISTVAALAQTSPGRANYGALKFSESSAWYAYLMLDLHRQTALREKELAEAFRSEQSMRCYIDSVRARLHRIAGKLPERGPLNSRVTGIAEGNGFRVEKVVFQSLPGRYVTAHLYLPADAKAPLPACIEMCGHGMDGKGSGSWAAQSMVANGMAVMVVDPIAQGERLQLIDKEGRSLTRGVTTEHTLLNPAYNLVGTSLAIQEYWDNSRAVDYLLSRPEIDGTRIGAYGFSGGGTQAAYLLALDERIQTGCVGLFFSSRERTLELMGPSDGCQQIPCEGRERIEIADLIMLMAPKPFIILDGKYDFVDHWGALRGFEELQRCYALLGHPENVAQYYAEDGHAMPVDVENRLVEWFRRGLSAGQGEQVKLTGPRWRGENMKCTAAGQVRLEYKDARSVMDETIGEMERLAPQRKTFCQQSDAVVKAKIMELLGLREGFNDRVEWLPTGRSSLREVEEYRFQLNCTGQMPVACVVWVPSTATPDSPVEIHLHEQGKAWYLNDLSKRDAVSDGRIIVAADFRGIGEMEDPSLYNLAKYWNREYRAAGTSMHIGRPLLGQRVADLRTLLNFCDTHELLKGHPLTIVADGLYGPVVMHAAVLDKRIGKARLSRCLKTWRDYMEHPLQRDMYANILYGVLAYYDLPDLTARSQGRVLVTD